LTSASRRLGKKGKPSRTKKNKEEDFLNKKYSIKRKKSKSKSKRRRKKMNEERVSKKSRENFPANSKNLAVKRRRTKNCRTKSVKRRKVSLQRSNKSRKGTKNTINTMMKIKIST
jgi:superfamily I DNA and RNA helicase